MYPYTYGHDQGPYVYPPHFPHLTTPSASTSTPNLSSPQDLNQPVTPGRLFQPLPWYPAQLPPERLSEMDSPTDNSRKRGQRNQGSSNRGNRRRRTAPSATSNENSTAIPETESHINPTATAEVCGVGPILAHTQRPPSPSKNPALNSRIFRAMAKKTGRGSGQVASDVWYNVRPYSKLISGIGKWHAWKNTNERALGLVSRDSFEGEAQGV
ncbi:hypothetical protein C8R41DRAFT_871170 [Lentinula lateritia]|uniref:Uncharacterized protein n=1 Tax=Lentinula lateritia TaxID=40482 RepID=A0ABQ8V5P9_9AGAR|nr:hypothetical protein C8R41DRAFT_871488 [Lentinula lateritia]KAJ4468481.1 hypothetical protein C8R41DRAFT_871170 [Lentinula lateritia]